jgi:cytochrome c oxidase accessory protein FixG
MSKMHSTNNQTIYVRASKGRYQRLRNIMGTFFICLFALLPWLTHDGKQAILIDLNLQQFHFFSISLYPEDLILLALFLLVAAFSLFFITSFIGRVWCAYLCPQTVWMYIFLWFEEKLEGPANKRRLQDKKKLTKKILIQKGLKHLAWFSLSLFTALTFIGYFTPIKALLADFVSFNLTPLISFWVIFFTACTYANAGWMRAIMCTHICPYSRFQSVLFDNNTYIVAYDETRGEKRGARKKNVPAPQLGDCIDCKLCLEVCPAGIDIRNGLQYECINCAACIDACDNTMAKMNLPKGLIRYTTANQLAGQKQKILRPKLIGYALIMCLNIGLFIYQSTQIKPVSLDVLRDKNQLYKINAEGLIENTYQIKIFNKSQQKQTYKVAVSEISEAKTKAPDPFTWYGEKTITALAHEQVILPVSLAIARDKLTKPITPILFTLSQADTFQEELFQKELPQKKTVEKISWQKSAQYENRFIQPK